jgi:hypothetical protein
MKPNHTATSRDWLGSLKNVHLSAYNPFEIKQLGNVTREAGDYSFRTRPDFETALQKVSQKPALSASRK